jgi:hypothetical protein
MVSRDIDRENYKIWRIPIDSCETTVVYFADLFFRG